MKQHNSVTLKDALPRVSAVVAMLFIAACAALGQAPPGSSAPAIVNPKGDTDAQTNREAMMRSAEIGSTAEQKNKQRLLAGIEQTKQDFKRIQFVRNNMVDDLVAKRPLDLKQISERADEVNKRAVRLKSYLMPPVPEVEKRTSEEKQVVYTEEELKGALVKLCNSIYSFTANEMFKNPGTLDTQKSMKAGSDLLVIIELSDNIKRTADKLGKSGK
jgi:hypothetical protein